MQHEICQERLQSIGLQASKRLIIKVDVKTAEQLDTQHGWTACGGIGKL
jgi:hypothetical protein